MVYKYIHRCTRDNVVYTGTEGSPFKVPHRKRKKPLCPMTKQAQFFQYEYMSSEHPKNKNKGEIILPVFAT